MNTSNIRRVEVTTYTIHGARGIWNLLRACVSMKFHDIQQTLQNVDIAYADTPSRGRYMVWLYVSKHFGFGCIWTPIHLPKKPSELVNLEDYRIHSPAFAPKLVSLKEIEFTQPRKRMPCFFPCELVVERKETKKKNSSKESALVNPKNPRTFWMAKKKAEEKICWWKFCAVKVIRCSWGLIHPI